MLEGKLNNGTGLSHIADRQCTAIFNISGFPQTAEYVERTKVAGVWRDPDRVIVFHIRLDPPTCNPHMDKTKRIQVKCASVL